LTTLIRPAATFSRSRERRIARRGRKFFWDGIPTTLPWAIIGRPFGASVRHRVAASRGGGDRFSGAPPSFCFDIERQSRCHFSDTERRAVARMTLKKFNVGIVGYGWASGAHIAAINATAHAQVKAICSSRALDSVELSARHGGKIACHEQLDRMLADKSLHVVAICSYPQDHARQAMAAARAGKHLIIEKPLALNWEECLAVQKAVKEAGVKTCVCFECRFSSQFLTIKSVIDRGLLGRIHYGEVDYYHGIGPWYGQFRWNTQRDAGGSSLLSAGCHALDALLLCMGEDVEVVSAYSTHSVNKEFAQYEYPTTSVTILKFADGRVGKVASVIDCLQP